ncbi:MAG: hypothetical protein JKY52_03610 [Flavobacteriales bacterium]|nr:hypothetical protein [Flavobacteriales bacterium]
MILTSEIAESIALRTASIYLRDDDIVCIRLKDNADIVLKDSKEMCATVKSLSGGEKKPVLVLTGSGGTITDEVRKFSASKEAADASLAEAIVAKSLAHKLAANFLIKFIDMGRPMKLFTNEEEAVLWLNKMRFEQYSD